MAEPREIAAEILSKSDPERLDHLTKILEMVQCGISIRGACRDRMFVSLSGKEDSGTKFDRLMWELFGLKWQDRPVKKSKRQKASEPQLPSEEKKS